MSKKVASGFADDDDDFWLSNGNNFLYRRLVDLTQELNRVRRTANAAWWIAVLSTIANVIYHHRTR
jgi:hypothetical protein